MLGSLPTEPLEVKLSSNLSLTKALTAFYNCLSLRHTAKISESDDLRDELNKVYILVSDFIIKHRDDTENKYTQRYLSRIAVILGDSFEDLSANCTSLQLLKCFNLYRGVYREAKPMINEIDPAIVEDWFSERNQYFESYKVY